MLIDVLTHVYNSGVDYIDIIGVQDDIQDLVKIVVEEDYINDDEDEEEETDKLSDEDINNLLDE